MCNWSWPSSRNLSMQPQWFGISVLCVVYWQTKYVDYCLCFYRRKNWKFCKILICNDALAICWKTIQYIQLLLLLSCSFGNRSDRCFQSGKLYYLLVVYPLPVTGTRSTEVRCRQSVVIRKPWAHQAGASWLLSWFQSRAAGRNAVEMQGLPPHMGNRPDRIIPDKIMLLM